MNIKNIKRIKNVFTGRHTSHSEKEGQRGQSGPGKMQGACRFSFEKVSEKILKGSGGDALVRRFRRENRKFLSMTRESYGGGDCYLRIIAGLMGFYGYDLCIHW